MKKIEQDNKLFLFNSHFYRKIECFVVAGRAKITRWIDGEVAVFKFVEVFRLWRLQISFSVHFVFHWIIELVVDGFQCSGFGVYGGS